MGAWEAVKEFAKGEPAALIGLTVAGVNLAVILGVHVSADVKATIVTAITAASAFLVRALVNPVAK